MLKLDDCQIVRSYVVAALYRVRVYLIFAIGLTPLLGTGQIYMFYRVRYATPLPEPIVGTTILRLLMFAAGLWGTILLAATIGVLVALLARRKPFVALGVAPFGARYHDAPHLDDCRWAAEHTHRLRLRVHRHHVFLC